MPSLSSFQPPPGNASCECAPHLILPSGELEKLIREPKLSLLQKAKQAGLKALGPASTP
jgi:hypothetical protein